LSILEFQTLLQHILFSTTAHYLTVMLFDKSPNGFFASLHCPSVTFLPQHQQHHQQQVLARMRGKRNPLALLVGM
jgi:hypothetical protein